MSIEGEIKSGEASEFGVSAKCKYPTQFGIPHLVARDIYQICVPLPNNALRVLNCYVVMEQPRPLVIDTGFDMPECYDALTQGLNALGLSWDEVDIFFTHGHPDHCGLVNRVGHENTTFYAGFSSFHELHRAYYAEIRGFRAWMSGGCEILPEGCLHPVLTAEEDQNVRDAAYDYGDMDEVAIPISDVELCVLKDGDTFQRGSRKFQVIGCTGHSPNHICLYDPADKTLICGDQMLAKITPVIASFALGENLLQNYLLSIEKLAQFDISTALTGHRALLQNVPARAKELAEHHEQRSREILLAMNAEAANLVDITKSVTWRNPIPNWDDWPIKQKFFSLGETLVHITFLESKGLVSHELTQGSVIFRQTY